MELHASTVAQLLAQLTNLKPSDLVVVIDRETGRPMPHEVGAAQVAGGQHDGRTVLAIRVGEA